MISKQQTDVLYIVTSLFDAAPGKLFLDTFTNNLLSGMSVQQLSNNLASTDVFKSIYSDSLTNFQFSEQFSSTLLGNTTNAANKSWAVNWMTGMLDQGASRGDVMFQATAALQNIPHSDPNWGNAAKALENKVTAAKIYSIDEAISEANLASLQSVVANIDETTMINTNNILSGTWFSKDVTANNIGSQTITFDEEGNYSSKDFNAKLEHGEINGTESGSYKWNPLTETLTATAITDNNGTLGFNNSPAQVSQTNGTLTLIHDNETFHFINQASLNTNALVGNWFAKDIDEGVNEINLSFFADGTYAWLENVANLGADELNGSELGNYQWDQQTGSLTSNTLSDYNGQLGINGQNLSIELIGSQLKLTHDDGVTFFNAI